jgi:hypothetical protein
MDKDISFNKAIVHNPNVPIRRRRKPLKVDKTQMKKMAEAKFAARIRRAAINAENKRIANGGAPEKTIKAPEQTSDEVVTAQTPVEETQEPAQELKAYIGTKDGKSYAQERHAEALAAKLDLAFDSIKETEDGYVVEVSKDEIPEGHVAIEGVTIK